MKIEYAGTASGWYWSTPNPAEKLHGPFGTCQEAIIDADTEMERRRGTRLGLVETHITRMAA